MKKGKKKKIESPTTRTYQLRGCFDLKWAQFLSAPHSLISYLQIIWKKERGLVFRISQLYLTSESQKKIPIVVVIHYCAWYLFLRLRRYVGILFWPTYTFISFPENFLPIRLFSPIFLLLFKQFSHLHFYSDPSSIRNSRVLSSLKQKNSPHMEL